MFVHARIRRRSWLAGFFVGIFGPIYQHMRGCTNMALTDTQVRTLKGKDKPYKLGDAEG
jgi:hypothetical protein